MKKRFALAVIVTTAIALGLVGCALRSRISRRSNSYQHRHQKIKELVALGHFVPLLRVFLFAGYHLVCCPMESLLFRLLECANRVELRIGKGVTIHGTAQRYLG